MSLSTVLSIRLLILPRFGILVSISPSPSSFLTLPCSRTPSRLQVTAFCCSYGVCESVFLLVTIPAINLRVMRYLGYLSFLEGFDGSCLSLSASCSLRLWAVRYSWKLKWIKHRNALIRRFFKQITYVLRNT
jgi:hypothetical protein